jgi:hypothetical protein
MKREGISPNIFASIYANCRIVILLTLLCTGTAAMIKATEKEGKSSPTNTPTAASARVPAYFEGNDGQFPAAVNFVARVPGYTVSFTRKEVVLTAVDPKHTARLRMQLARSNGELVGADPLPGKVNYFLGSDPAKWQRGVPIYGRIIRRNAYPGIDVVYRIEDAKIEYDLIVAPDADPRRIKLYFNGAKRLTIDSSGDLVLVTTAGEVRLRKPTVYQESSSGRKELDGDFVLDSKGQVGFKLAHYDSSKALVIDPVIVYSSYLGGQSVPLGFQQQSATGIAVSTDATTGHTYTYLTGYTCATDFPIVNPEQRVIGGGCSPGSLPNGAGGDAFISKFDTSVSGNASLIYSTYLGGSGADRASGIAVDSAGDAYVIGTTNSTNFPTLNAYQSAIKFGRLCSDCISAAQDGFLAKLSADGTTLLYSTYFGGSGADTANAIALDSAGHAYISGSTNSADLPLINALQSSPPPADGLTGFLAVFDTTAAGSSSLLYSTYLGSLVLGGGAYAIAVDASNTVHVGGSTGPGFPVVNGFQSGILGSISVCAGFYARLNPWAIAPAQLVYSTYLGGGGQIGSTYCDTVYGIALDASGNAYLTGKTVSGLFPATPSAYQPPSQPHLWFAAKINPSLVGSPSLIYSTFMPNSGGGGVVTPPAIAVDGNGDAFLLTSYDGSFPLINPGQGSVDGVLQSVDGGLTWTNPSNSLTDSPVTAIALDASTEPRTLYAGTGIGSIFASADGGLNWNRVFQLQPGNNQCNDSYNASTSCVFALAVDPTTPSTVYAGTSAGIYNSMDRGATWTTLSTGFASNPESVNDLDFDVGTLYAATADGIYKLVTGTTTWVQTAFTPNTHHVVVDPTTHTIYATVDPTNAFGDANSAAGIYKSSDGGNSWTVVQPPPGPSCPSNVLAINTSTNPPELYADNPCSTYDSTASFYVSRNGGITWSSADNNSSMQADPYWGSLGDPDAILKVDSAASPPTIYFASPEQGGFWMSKDHGNSWSPIWGFGDEGGIGAIVLDPSTATATTPSVAYTGTGPSVRRAFVAELSPDGSALLFSSYVGGIFGGTYGYAITLDNASNIYVTGSSDSRYFPIVSGYEAASVPSNINFAFVMKIGSQALPTSSSSSVSTQLGVQTGLLTVTLPNVTGSTTNSVPTLTATPLSSAQTANFSLSNNLGAYDISTTALYSGSVTLCFQVNTVNDPTIFNDLSLIHIVSGTPVDVTSSRTFATRTICGSVTSFSPFILVKGALGQLQDLVRSVNESDLRKGIQNSLDAKLQNAESAFSSDASHNYANVCNMMNAFINNVAAQTGQFLTTAEATQFTVAAKQIKATLGCAQ